MFGCTQVFAHLGEKKNKNEKNEERKVKDYWNFIGQLRTEL